MEAILDAITAYMECPQCGRKALSVATRCPHCGVAFPSKPLRRSAPGYRLDRLRPVLAVGGVLLLGAVLLAVVMPRLGSKAAVPPPGAASGETSPTLAAAAPGATPADSTGEGVASDSVVPKASTPDRDAPAPASPLARRVARTWVNVRDARGLAGPAVRVLNPGDTVQVDSLTRGWYRVLIDGRAVGYVHRSNLDPVPPPP
jgi:SH3 domain-containing protein